METNLIYSAKTYELIWSRLNSYAFEIALEKDLLNFLEDSPKSMEEISEYAELPVQSTMLLLQYLCALGLVSFNGNSFGTPPQSSWLLLNKDFGIQQSNEHLKCIIFDIPQAVELTEKFLYDKLNKKLIISEGDMVNLIIAEDFDVALLANVLHDWNQSDCIKILKNVYEKLSADGELLVFEYFLEDDWSGPANFLYNGVTVLGQDDYSGWQPTFMEMEGLLQVAGFTSFERKENLLIAGK